MDDVWIFLFLSLALYCLGVVAAAMANLGGHLLAAAACSIRLQEIIIGVGPTVLRRRFGGVPLRWRLVPLGGIIIPVPEQRIEKRWQVVLYFAGGILGNIAVITAVIFLQAVGAMPIVLYGPPNVPWPTLQTIIFVGAQVPLIICAFVPAWISLNGKAYPVLGYQWLQLASGGKPWALSVAPYASAKTKLPFVSARSRRIADLRAQVKDWSNEDQRNGYYEALRYELLETPLPAEEEMYILDVLITDALILADPTLLTELDQWSLRALQLGPDIATLVGSRGAALVELGRYEEGKVLLETIAQANDPAPFDLLMSRLFLARAEHALSSSVSAAELMTQVRAATDVIEGYRPEVMVLVERIEREIQGSL